ncbi:MAG: hypothetical protein PHX80_05335 [Candidatus Nanoarchaeia archaeon]|nr:hypothetical protein [Candidatus Nanoarchaeia archaeon]
MEFDSENISPDPDQKITVEIERLQNLAHEQYTHGKPEFNDTMKQLQKLQKKYNKQLIS